MTRRQFVAVAIVSTALVVSTLITVWMRGPTNKGASIEDLMDRVRQTARERN